MGLFSLNTKRNNIYDGPYVFYGNNTEVCTIEGKNCIKTSNTEEPFFIRFSNQENWDFSIRLKKSLSNENCIWQSAEKIFVLSDVEGEFAVFRKLLLANKIIDEHYNWIFGNGHLVVNGDMFDRGSEVTSMLWLIYKLEEDAKPHGGYVHTIIGNHEVMNLSGDLRYVDKKYFDHAALMNLDYMQLFDAHTELGRWLRTKNVMEKIGDYLFVHGGVSPSVNDLKLSIEDINNKCRPHYDKVDNGEAEALQSLYNRQALYWYRGYFTEPRASIKDVNETLKLYDCKKIIVGHTILSDRNPALYYEGKVLNIDVNHHKGIHAAALIENDKCFATDDEGNKTLLVYKPENDIIDKDKIG